jgi:hypothetical protein
MAQLSDAQSVPSRQRWSLAQRVSQVPPQSMSLSLPFCALSLQVGQAAQLPPQSTPVSSPLSMPSLHTGQGVQLGPQSTPASSPSRTLLWQSPLLGLGL